jgi:hypothetical protein
MNNPARLQALTSDVAKNRERTVGALRRSHSLRFSSPIDDLQATPLSRLDLVDIRSGKLMHPGSVILGVSGVLFLMCVLKVAGARTHLERMFHGVGGSDALTGVLIAAAPCVAVLLGVVWVFAMAGRLQQGLRRYRKARRVALREAASAQEFAELVKDEGVSSKAAREVYGLLLPQYQDRMRVRLSDELAMHLDMSVGAIADLYTKALRHTDRQRPLGGRETRMKTVLELLLAVERSPRRALSLREMPPAMHIDHHVRVRTIAAGRGEQVLQMSPPQLGFEMRFTEAARLRGR